MAAPPISERHLHHFHRRSPIKEAVRVATTANITIATALNNGDTLDGITLATGDRVLVKNQSTGSQNGIYEVGASPARAYDVSTDDPAFGFLVYVREGTTNGGTLWANTNTTAPTIDSTSLTFAEFTTGGSSSSLPWFVVTDYGAVHDGTTDDTAAIQSAIDAAETAGGGVVYFPIGVYKIAGALQDTGRSNAQILLPRISDSGGEQITIHLLGEVAPPSVPYISGSSVDPDNGPVLKSTLSSGTGSVIGSWGPSGAYLNFSLIRARVENLIIRTVANPTNSGLDLSHVQTCELSDVMVDAGEYTMGSISQQTTSTSYGIQLPGNNNGASTSLSGVVNVVGFYNGILVGEHTVAENVQVWAARKAYVFPAAYHASKFGRMAYYHCQRGLVFSASKHYLVIDELNVEHAASGTWVNTYDIDDASNYGYGHVAWHVVLEVTGYDSTWTVNGATNLHQIEIGSNPYGGSSFATPSIVLGSSAATGAASTVIRSDATIAAFDATSPTTQAIGDSAVVGSAAFAARRDHKHAMPAFGSPVATSTANSDGVATSVARSDHVHASTGSGGFLAISDTHSSPLVFDDILQSDDGDDFVYMDG